MDWKNLQQKATELAKKWFETGKEYAEKTGVWTYEKLKESTFTLKDLSSYEELQKEKRYAIFAIRDGDTFTKSFLLLLPVLFTKAWIESGSIRILIEEGTEDLRKSIGIDTIPSVILKMNDGTVKKITQEEEIRTLMKNFSFYEEK